MRLPMGEWILTASILILLVLLIRLVFKRRLTAKVRYGIWLLVLLRLLLPVSFFNSSFSLLHFLPKQETELNILPADGFWQMPTAQKPADTQNFPMQEWQPQISGLQTGGEINDLPKSDRGELSRFLTSKDLLLTLWGTGAAATLLIIGGSNLYFIYKVRRLRKKEADLSKEQPLPVYLSEEVPMPCMFGLFRPAVYVRTEDTDNEEKLSYILRHEVTHYRHGDHIWAFFRGLSLILHWYNPLVWIAAGLSRKDAELACDESVIRTFSAEETEAYGKVLIALSVQNLDHRMILSCATTLGSGKKDLKERVSRIAQRPRLFFLSTAAVIVLCIAALVFTFTGGNGRVKAEDEDTAMLPETEEEDTVLSPETKEDTEPVTIETPEDIELWLSEGELFINDYFVDMNGDGVLDVLRLSSIVEKSDMEDIFADESLSEALRTAVERNRASYYQIALYDGARAADIQTFRKGDALNEEALIETFEMGQPHAGNGQYSFYEEEQRGFMVRNSPWSGQGYAYYTYEVFTYTNTWKKAVVASGELDFSDFPYTPNTWMSPDAYMAEVFPMEDMIAYAMDLKNYLDKAVILMDTNIDRSPSAIFTTCFEDRYYRPEVSPLFGGDTEEALRESLTELYDTVLYELSGFSPFNPDLVDEEVAALQNELGWEITYSWDAPPAGGMTAYGELPAYIVDAVIQNIKEELIQDGEARLVSWEDWKITQLAYFGTYRMGDHTLDVYVYDYWCKLDPEINIKELEQGNFRAGDITDKRDGWFWLNNGRCMIYDREQGSCFDFKSNDSSPGIDEFTRELLFYYANRVTK